MSSEYLGFHPEDFKPRENRWFGFHITGLMFNDPEFREKGRGAIRFQNRLNQSVEVSCPPSSIDHSTLADLYQQGFMGTMGEFRELNEQYGHTFVVKDGDLCVRKRCYVFNLDGLGFRYEWLEPYRAESVDGREKPKKLDPKFVELSPDEYEKLEAYLLQIESGKFVKVGFS